jgi:amino acid transporter
MNSVTRMLATALTGAAMLGALFAPMIGVSAQGFTSDETGLPETADKAGFTTNLPCREQPGGCIPVFIGTLVNALLGIFGAIFLMLIIWGGVQYMFAQGDTEKVKKAQQTLKNAILGMLIVAASYAIASYVLEKVGEAVEQSGTAAEVSPNP